MAVLQRSAVYQSARKRPGFTSQAERARLLSQPLRHARSVRAESSQGSVQARVAELNSYPAQPLMLAVRCTSVAVHSAAANFRVSRYV